VHCPPRHAAHDRRRRRRRRAVPGARRRRTRSFARPGVGCVHG
jgi:hypothetical protein